ncbi:hypothetical protein KQI89_17355 [Clostridium sp. MSJ-4]|uniref:DUF3953 domain-containing protein n=1 Tax=Clostridium simiarum TaxID=2841506 RepID=A0ABS6F4Q5_9CLOT|nr:hypothetical protein [Clostridium simiarum]MBU5593506.1 hypothetical protein [Clostridium simiarum]
MKIRYSSSVMLVLGVFFIIYYCFTDYTNIKALESVVFTHFAVEFLMVYKEKGDIKKNWIYLFLGVTLSICAIIAFVVFFK